MIARYRDSGLICHFAFIAVEFYGQLFVVVIDLHAGDRKQGPVFGINSAGDPADRKLISRIPVNMYDVCIIIHIDGSLGYISLFIFKFICKRLFRARIPETECQPEKIR